jgi:phosphonopyruvate decarboxylase
VTLDGDGSLLMNLGSLATIAAAAPRNLAHLVFVNGVYEANGSHPLPGRETLDFAAIARGAGIANARTIDSLAAFEAALPEILEAPGPVFRALKVVAGEPSPQDYAYIHGAETRRRFGEAFRR